MEEYELEGKAVVQWLKTADLGIAAQLLLGCELDDNQSSHLFQITGVEIDKALTCVLASQTKRVSLARLAACSVYVSRAD